LRPPWGKKHRKHGLSCVLMEAEAAISDHFDVTVEKLVYGGDGLGRWEGRVVLIPFVLPGEIIRAAPRQQRGGLVRAQAAAILRAAPNRVVASCPYFTRCGGCHYQHVSYEDQLAAKRAILAEELRRIGKLEPPEEIEVVAAEPWGYRNRVQLHLCGGRIGYWAARSHQLCAIDHCPISSPQVNRVISALNEMIRDARWPRFLRSIEIFTDERQVQVNVVETDRPLARRFFDWAADVIPGWVPGPLDYQGQFRVSRNSFFQVNRFLLDQLVDLATRQAEGESALDLYAGVGLFSLALGKKFREVTAVESGSGAIRDLAFNAERAGFAHVRPVHRTAEEHLAGLSRAPDFVLLDPPRAGLGKNMIGRLAVLRPRQLTLVSCDPATLARDLGSLRKAGYQIASLAMIDLFPQTFHLETVTRLYWP
jgi:23S rRNA (uracil1939-C5)-methyltransferase